MLSLLVKVVLPNTSMGPEKCPVTKTFPEASVAIPIPISPFVQPARLAHNAFPDGSYLTTKISLLPVAAFVKVKLPNVTVELVKAPVTNTFPALSLQML